MSTNSSIHKHLHLARTMTTWLDDKFRIAGLSFGVDPLLDFIPGIGSMAAAGLSCYLLWIALQLDLPKHLVIKMLWHIALDFLLGLVPIVGYAADFFYKSNRKNLALLEEYVGEHIPLTGKMLE